MTNTTVWLIVIIVGLAALGVFNLARSGKLGGVKWRDVQVAALGVSVILLAVTAGGLAIPGS